MSADSGRSSFRPEEAARDQSESAFTPILRRVYNGDPRVLYAVFVDSEGECIDYVSAIDPFEAKVAGAHALVLLNALGCDGARRQLGEAHTLEIATEDRELWARRVSEDYALVLLMRLGIDRPRLQHALATACREFRAEVGIGLPAWERPPRPVSRELLSVTVRPAVGWGYAPSAFASEDEQFEISDVLGRWEESAGDALRVCFRVRTTDGREFSLVHHTTEDAWSLTA